MRVGSQVLWNRIEMVGGGVVVEVVETVVDGIAEAAEAIVHLQVVLLLLLLVLLAYDVGHI